MALMTSNRTCAMALLAALMASAAQAAPGEDPVTISNRVSYLQLPTAPMTRSGSIDYRRDIADDIAAKASRYTAKAYSAETGGVKTEKDVVQSVRTNGTQTICTQSVGSVSAPAGGGIRASTNEQVVVLRGDLINICN